MPNNEVEELKESFIKDLNPLKIYLFGSFATGEETSNSDFDFYIVVDDQEIDMIELTAKAYKSIRNKQKRSVDIIVNTVSRFNKRKSGATLEHEVLEKGILLFVA